VVEPSPLDTSIGYLCSLALHSAEAQEWLGEQLETIHELREHLRGTRILHAILAGRPDAASPAAINGFLSSLAEADRLALHADPNCFEALPEKPLAAAEEALAACSALALEKQDQAIKAALAEPDLPIARQIELLGRAKEIADLLSGMPGRALTTDRFAPNRRRQKSPGPWNKGDFRAERKP